MRQRGARGRRGWVLVTAAVGWSSLLAAPAGAHHDPDALAAAEAAVEATPAAPAVLPGDGGATGLPIGLVGAATVVLAALIVMAHRRRASRHGPPATSGRRPCPQPAAVVAVLALVAVPLSAVAAPAGAADLLLPDLVSDEPDPSGSVEVNTSTGTPRLVLRFDGYVTNVGEGPLEVSGNPQITDSADPAAVHQRARDTAGGWHVVGTPIVQFETADGHNHFHLMEVGRYSLWNEARTAPAAPGQKVGFCLYDIERAEAADYSGPQYPRVYSGSVTQFCDAGNPTSTDLVMGTSAGWRDVYGAYLTFQWVDVSETAPGVYYLANEADPHDRILESDETNNQIAFARTPSVIPGYNALPVASVVPDGGPAPVALSSDRFGSPGARRFEIVTPPAHGSLDVPTGVAFSGETVTYTPDPGHTGPDSFEYVARDASSAFPLTPTRAAVSITVGDPVGPTVEISGAPASLIAGTSAPLTATVTNGSGPVTWSVDGIVGGDATVGTVSPSGLFVAPDSPPAGGAVAVRAALQADPTVFDEVTITIDPVPNTAPQVATPDDQASTVGESISLLVEANDPDGDPFTFSAAGLPAGLSIHPTTGVITGRPTAVGSSTVTVTVDDGRDPTEVSFDWLVEARPRVTPGIAVIWEGDGGTTTVEVPVRLSAAVRAPVTVSWTTADTGAPGIATEGVDFVADAGVVAFAPGQTEATVSIEVVGDTVDEPPAWLGEWGIVSFAAPSDNADLDRAFFGLGIFVIVDDD